MKERPRYWVPQDFYDIQVESARFLFEDNPNSFFLGYPFPFYSAVILAVTYCDELVLEEFVDDELDEFAYKKQKVTISGRQFLKPYEAGFLAGLAEFNDKYRASLGALYTPGETNLINNLHRLYKHGYDGAQAWESRAAANLRIICDDSVYSCGLYAGLCYSVDEVVRNHPHLYDAIYTCEEQIEQHTNNAKNRPQTLSDIWVETKDGEGKQQFYNEVISILIKNKYIQQVNGEIHWIESQKLLAGFIRTCIDKGWVLNIYTAPTFQNILNQTFNTSFRSSTPYKTEDLYSLPDRHISPFKSMRQNIK